MQTITNLQIIPYTREALEWHLRSNVFGLLDITIAKVLDICDQVNNGEMELLDTIGKSNTTIAELLDDMHIDYNDDSILY